MLKKNNFIKLANLNYILLYDLKKKNVLYLERIHNWLYMFFNYETLSLYLFKNQLNLNLNFSSNYKSKLKLTSYLINMYVYSFVKISFRGKGYRIRKFKNKNKIIFNFGHSHWTRLYYNSDYLYIRRTMRQNFFCLFKKNDILFNFCDSIKTLKKLNKYTKRGLRLKIQPIHRRFGKISQVVSSLH